MLKLLKFRIFSSDFRPEYDPSLEPSLVNLLKKCLEKNPKKRYQIQDILLDDWVTYNSTQALLNLPLERKYEFDAQFDYNEYLGAGREYEEPLDEYFDEEISRGGEPLLQNFYSHR